MKIWIIAAMIINSTAFANPEFEKYFSDSTMRIDYFHIGSAKQELITIDLIYKYGVWAGNKKNLIDNFNNGKYYTKIYDSESGDLIFSKGFDTYFGEYKLSSKGEAGIDKSYHESALIPYPKNKIAFVIEKRNNENILVEFFRLEIDPESVEIIKDEILDKNVTVFESLKNGDPHNKVDVVILAEGYTENEKDKFEKDLERFTQIFFELDPYKSLKNNFNIYGVFKASEESGTDEPESGIHKKTVLNTTFNSLGSERYLLTEDNKAVRDLAAHVPYDAIYIMVNHSRYGGGGIYNLYCTFTSDNQWYKYLFIHEFGHSFAGLADEYYTSETAYNDFYPKGIEPVEPNITALLNPPYVKWKDKLTKNVEIPTPWEKEGYDKLDLKWQQERRELNKNIARLKREHAPIEEIEKAIKIYDEKDRSHNEKLGEYFKKSDFNNVVGAFKGAGYSSEGLYRPMLDCIMFSKGTKPFCKICENAVIKVVEHYSR
jgi:hypothetical protein